MTKRDFKVLNEREHILTRPAMYIGSIVGVEKDAWIYEEGKFKYTATKYVPALLKICDEIVDNSLDVAIDSDFKKIKNIKVNVSDTKIEVVDDGPGIPVSPPDGGDQKGRNCPEIAWTQMRSGTSFKENRKGPSANGVGSTCCNVFCTSFIGTSDDGKKRQTVECSDNMSIINVSKETKSKGKTGVTVKMVPDLKRFGLKNIDEVHKGLIYQRLLNLAICYPQLRFFFNGKEIKVNGQKFGSMFSDSSIVKVTKNATLVVFPNEYDEFKYYSYVNGLNCVRGGSQVDVVAQEICSRVKDKLVKKYKSIRPADIKNRMGLVVFLTDFENAQFDAQTKESLSNSRGDILNHLKDVDWDDLAKVVLKNASIINPIVETFKIKEELKARSEMKIKKRAKIKSDKYMSAIGKNRHLLLCEGLSAQSGLSACLGRQGFGYYAMRGLPINGYSQSIQKISANQEFKDIMNILGLDVSKGVVNEKINYDKIVIATDADCDGSHITSMLIGWFKRFAPELFALGKICKLITPLILLKDAKGKITKWFFNTDEFKKWEKTNTKKCEILYMKGLGSWERSDLQSIIDKEGIESFIKELSLDDKSENTIEDWLGDNSEPRKVYLRDYIFDINQA